MVEFTSPPLPEVVLVKKNTLVKARSGLSFVRGLLDFAYHCVVFNS
jgi:hypothetical protein